MDGRIGHLRSHYRMVGAQVAAPSMALRLDRVLREAVVRNYGDALQSALGGDESVYVLRRVKTRLSLTLGMDGTDAAIAKSWSSHLAAAVMRAIANRDDDAGNVVRFENQAAYVASFVVAVLKGTQHEQWFYDSFNRFRGLDTKTAVRRVLLANTNRVPAILAHVHRSGKLDSLLAVLDPQTKQSLWWPIAEQRDDLEVSRSLFTTAVQFLRKLGVSKRIPRNTEDLFRSYRDTAPRFADWRDPRSLAESVLEVVRFLFARGYCSLRSQSSTEFSVRVGKALEEFEWLDREWLKSSVLKLLNRDDDRAATDLPLRGTSGRATPRQRELLEAIATVLGDAEVLGGSGDDRLSAALRVLALLVDAGPGWADDTAAKVMIENLLTSAAAMQEATSREEFVKRLQCRDVEGALRMLPDEQRARVKEACRMIASLGEPALELVERLASQKTSPVLAEGVESQCAGVALLLRTMLDARLHALTDETSYPTTGERPPAVMLLVLIALRLHGESVFANGELDAGLRLLAGMDQTSNIDTLRACWSTADTANHVGFQRALLSIVAGQRLIEPATMRVFDVDLTGGTRALVAADESKTVWPLACVIDTNAEIREIISDWKAAWENATGVTPQVVFNDCVTSRKNFLEAMAALDQGQTANPNLDLTTTIVTCLLLRMWARWLRGFSTSSVDFLIENFIRRPGTFRAQKDCLLVELERRPLDVVLRMAGYLSDLERIPWLASSRIKFSLKGE